MTAMNDDLFDAITALDEGVSSALCDSANTIAEAIRNAFDHGGGEGNVVTAIYSLAFNAGNIADAINNLADAVREGQSQ